MTHTCVVRINASRSWPYLCDALSVRVMPTHSFINKLIMIVIGSYVHNGLPGLFQRPAAPSTDKFVHSLWTSAIDFEDLDSNTHPEKSTHTNKNNHPTKASQPISPGTSCSSTTAHDSRASDIPPLPRREREKELHET